MSKIEWTNQTWNPIIGCSKVSPGCKNCYAETMANRLSSIALIKQTDEFENFDISGLGAYAMVVKDGKWNGTTRMVPNALKKPLKRKKPTMYFVCSMSDIFHETVPFEWIYEVFDVMALTPQHTYQVLTKRPKRMLEYFKHLGQRIKEAGFDSIPTQSNDPLNYYDALPNLWLGVTAENQEQANKRIPILLQIPAKVRFVSAEPLLSAVDLTNFISTQVTHYENQLDWVIVGAESGPKRRECKTEWVENIVNQCELTGTSVFVKQLYWNNKKISSPLVNMKVYNQFPNATN